MAKFLGRAVITVDGIELPSMPGATIDIGGPKRTEVVLDNGTVGFSEEPTPSAVECTITMDKNTRLAAMRDWDDVTISFACDTGQRYVVNNAFSLNPPKATAKDGGSIPLMFKGPPAIESE
ncbi:MAG: hypothetical protein GC184_14620 [Rhizobiales bacterium]|nr:hypothetical protein [Hyphomicrobiales bacterium]